MKLLLYCVKQPHKLYSTDKGYVITDFELGDYYKTKEKLNGKIVAECDFEVEEIKRVNYDCMMVTDTLDTDALLEKSYMLYFELEDYLKPDWSKEDDLENLEVIGYAIHIKNLHIFDKPKELWDYYSDLQRWFEIQAPRIKKAPQNMMYAYDKNMMSYYLISIRPEWLCKILNGEKKIDIRKKVLKELLK